MVACSASSLAAESAKIGSFSTVIAVDLLVKANRTRSRYVRVDMIMRQSSFGKPVLTDMTSRIELAGFGAFGDIVART